MNQMRKSQRTPVSGLGLKTGLGKNSPFSRARINPPPPLASRPGVASPSRCPGNALFTSLLSSSGRSGRHLGKTLVGWRAFLGDRRLGRARSVCSFVSKIVFFVGLSFLV
ncbi:hypothetical protein TNCT_686071 [Trichonephila clavata]|uniref:Uncharacterized protein n=1 Tax=Trichonephila clavata TaxID=2740835 RepID=A0A8X6LZA5_TRICU|nr:hypothetical protein TNCT_686071 [Trichonephila clavata]